MLCSVDVEPFPEKRFMDPEPGGKSAGAHTPMAPPLHSGNIVVPGERTRLPYMVSNYPFFWGPLPRREGNGLSKYIC